jgi:hypothetical protein
MTPELPVPARETVFDGAIVLDGVLAVAAELLEGALAIHLATLAVFYDEKPDPGGFEAAVLTALIAAVTWALLASVPALGALLALVGWVAVLHWRSPGDLVDSLLVAALSIVAALVVLLGLEVLGLHGLDALGVPLA